MARCRFVQPDVIRLPLSDGDYIDVKKELNAGEQRRVFSRLVKAMHFSEKPEIDPEQVGLSKVVEYLVGWSFADAQGKPVPVSEAAISNLDGETYGEIVKAIDAHDDAVTQERETRKNETADTTKS
jgi:hypothetical protein